MDRGTEAPCASSSGQEPTETTVLSTTIEWNLDMESGSVSLGFSDGPARDFNLKSRCKTCWGPLRGRSDSERNVTGIKCLICGRMLEGEPAASEERRIFREATFNAMNIRLGNYPTYGDGPFAQKVLPEFDRQTKREFADRITRNKSKYAKSPRRMLTRHDFSQPGSPARFFLQARCLMDGIGYPAAEAAGSVVDFPEFDVNPDGSVSVHVSMDGISENPRHKEHDLLSRMGSLMGSAMISAFACELTLKAIAITCNDEATKTHDLIELFEGLPLDSQERLIADYPGIKDVLESGRDVFGKWRYFDAAVEHDGLNSMIVPSRARDLAKSARVILDEALFVGLYGSVRVNARRTTLVSGETRAHDYTMDVTITSGESPPRK